MASIFAEAGKRTPVFVRFSTVVGSRGSADTVRDVVSRRVPVGTVLGTTIRRDGRRGVLSVDPTRVHGNPLPPPVVLDSLVIDSIEVPINGSSVAGRLHPNHERLEFHYSGLSFVAPHNVLFKYRLEGIDKISMIRFTAGDVVRHPLVGRIVDAYEGRTL
mgnify:CR=1 FL=1